MQETRALLHKWLGGRWETLTHEQQIAVLLDLMDMMDEEERTAEDALAELGRRIGGSDALSSYADTLLAGLWRQDYGDGSTAAYGIQSSY